MRLNISRPGKNGYRLLMIWRDDNKDREECLEIPPDASLDINIDWKVGVRTTLYSRGGKPLEKK